MTTVLDVHGPKPLWLEQVSARSLEVLEDPALRDLPYKGENNRRGPSITSPAKNVQGRYRTRIADVLERSSGGVASGFAVDVADVAFDPEGG